MSELPHGWANAALSELIGPSGEFADGDWVETKDQDPGGSIRLLQLADIGDGVFLDKSNRFINERKFVDLRCTEVIPGDVLIARMPDPLGRACLAPMSPQKRITVVDVAIVRPGIESVEPSWLMHFLNAPQIRAVIELEASGTTRRRISRGKLAAISLPVPPVTEQQRIARKLDSTIARVRACRERLDRVPQILKKFREAVLEAAVSGNLTEEWRITNELRRKWSATDIQSISHVSTGSTPLRSHANYYSGTGTPWITSAATSQPLVSHAEEFVTEAAMKAHRLKVFPIGTLLVAMYGEGKTRGQVTELAIRAAINQACAAIVVNEAIANKGFVKLALQANYYQMRALAEGGNQPNLNLTKIKEFPISLPSLAEQQEVVRRANGLFASAEALRRRYEEGRAIVGKLIPSVLAKAFRGDLVPQDLNDEPAERLVERIRVALDPPRGGQPHSKDEALERKTVQRVT